ncbi:unnamed protein product [Miscanthus lutarioriparius]|uniref:3-beta hydroxysteroid dehydrogenase/isomerase domain-containing protein n=1 Tax=Miscanthus lutarioriparius TaxID=422564 RepID=A0A811MAB2_9POAL|nr:unnamed protein product [Miscanthus lutarioriparius]
MSSALSYLGVCHCYTGIADSVLWFCIARARCSLRMGRCHEQASGYTSSWAALAVPACGAIAVLPSRACTSAIFPYLVRVVSRYLVAALLRSDDWRVRVVDLAPTVVLGTGEAEELLGAAIQDGQASYIQGDVRDLTQIAKAFEGVHVVFHTAAPDAINENFGLHYSVNVEGTKNVVEACIMCKVKRLIYTSSSGVVFDGVHGLFDADESMPYPFKFVDAYTQTKAEGEKIVMKANGTKGLLTCCIRPGNIFGPGGKNIPMLASSRIWKFMRKLCLVRRVQRYSWRARISRI